MAWLDKPEYYEMKETEKKLKILKAKFDSQEKPSSSKSSQKFNSITGELKETKINLYPNKAFRFLKSKTGTFKNGNKFFTFYFNKEDKK